MLWNLLDDGVAWVVELDRLAVTEACITGFPDPPALAGFTAGRRIDVAWQQPLSKDELVDLARTWSMVRTRPPAERDQVLGRVRHLLSTHPDLAAHETIDLPYVCSTRAYRSATAGEARCPEP
jgi:hypothetical protein